MKKIIFISLIFTTFLIHAFSQSNDAEKINKEYYGLKWGCSINELKKQYPDAYAQGRNDDDDELYYLDSKGNTRVFFFGNGKLYRGRMAYTDCSQEKLVALMQKLVDTYGKFDDTYEGSSNGNKYVTFTKDYSDTIKISLQILSIINSYGNTTSELVFIDFENQNLKREIAKERIQQMQDDLEL